MATARRLRAEAYVNCILCLGFDLGLEVVVVLLYDEVVFGMDDLFLLGCF